MKTIEIIGQAQKKRAYDAPQIEKVELDTEMSLLMASEPPPHPASINPGGVLPKVFKFIG
jgi:hypothetical protein